MAFSFNANHSEVLSLENLTKQQALLVSYELVNQLGWNIHHLSENGIIAFTNRGLFSWIAKVTIKINDESISIISESVGSEMIDFGRNKKNVRKFTFPFYDLSYLNDTSDLQERYEALKPLLETTEHAELKEINNENTPGFLSLFIPKEGYFITPVVILLNIAVFVYMVLYGVSVFMPSSQDLINWGANFRPVTLQGQWWRLFTCCFLHIGIFHLLLNMYALMYIGILLEPLLGKTKFITAYLITGISASIVSLWWHDLTVSAGASGAIFGMYGVFLALLTTSLIEQSARKALLTSIGVFVLYNLMNGMKAGIDNAAHIGGLLSGLIIGYAFIPSLKNKEDKKLELFIPFSLTVAALVIIGIVYKSLNNDIVVYEKKMDEFAKLEKAALKIYNLPNGTPNQTILYEIKERGVYNWNQSIIVLKEARKLEISPKLLTKTDLLIDYCNERINCYNFIYKSIDEHTDIYKDSITYYDQQVHQTIERIKKQ